jgi:hypothetical protein
LPSPLHAFLPGNVPAHLFSPRTIYATSSQKGKVWS